MQTEVVLSCLPFIRSGKNHFARHSKRVKQTRQTEEEVGRQHCTVKGGKTRQTEEEIRRHQKIDRPGVCQVPEGNGEQRKLAEMGCEVICDAPTTPAVKG